MCHPAPGSSARPARAVSLADGAAHDHDHEAWTRRQVLKGLGLGAAGAALWGGAVPARAFAGSPLLGALGRAETDRVLVLVQLVGGNDGLNTVVPVRNDVYYQARPTLAVPKAGTWALDGDTGLHDALAALRPTWDDGRLAVVQSVGYDSPSLSHFRATDIWLSGSDADDVLSTGWLGRSMGGQYPDFQEAPPAAPPAIQIGSAAPLLFQDGASGYSMSVADVDQFLRVVQQRSPFDASDVPPTPAGDELAFLRTVANDAFRYRDAIADASERGRNAAEYPAEPFAKTLRAVARLVKGRMDTRVYLVSLKGFDTHAGQGERHPALLKRLGEALAAFYADLGASGDDERVLALTFSEFGRRVEENGSAGTDHGAAAPLFMMGSAVQGGLWGEAPDLGDVDRVGNVRHSTDFRQVYATVLERWLGLGGAAVAEALGGPFAALDVLPARSATATDDPFAITGLVLDPPRPNPLRGAAVVSYVLPAPGTVRLSVFDAAGRRVSVLADGAHGAGRHEARLDAGGLAAGVYVLRLETPGGAVSRRATVVR